jgi:bifunctional non-homologous end joining protein LigD
MMGMMQRLKVDRRPIETIPYVNREPVWLQPQLVVEVKFQGWTTDGIMRAPIFVRLRYDKRPEDCIAEVPRATKDMVSRVTLAAEIKSDKVDHSFSNLDKVFWPASPQTDNRQITKQDLIEYYDGVSEHLLPHLRDRPLSLSRYPDGIKGKSFYHKNWHQTRPDYVKTIKVYSESSQRVINYIMCNNLSSLLWLANLGCIEIHPWYSRVHDYSACNRVASRSEEKGESILEESNCGLNLPDYVVFDLDPFIYSGSEAADGDPEYNVKGFKAAVEVALMLKDLLDGLRIKSYVKTSGKTGLHVFVPVTPDYTYDQTRAFAEVIGRILIRQGMKKITMDWQVRKRKGKVFFDYNQNSMGKTLASLYSARPTASATVSMPVDWQKLEQVLPTDFTIHSVPKLLKKTGDPWQMILKKQQDLAMLLRHVNEIGPG